MNKNKFQLVHWKSEGEKLLVEARNLLSKAPSLKVKELAKTIPQKLLGDDSPIRIVFAGQYSAGKSSIIKALTGREDIEIGEGIVTSKITDYNFDDIIITDSPGIHTELRPDHDELTYHAIAGSDLIVYVITYNLFDDTLAKNFRRLAIDRNKAREMMLVVNKMSGADQGNTPEMHKIICDALREVLSPFTPEALRISFVDAESYLDAQSESDSEVKNIYLRRSGIEQFSESLNKFAQEQGLGGKLTTPLYQLEHTLLEALSAESTGDVDVDGLEEILLQKRRAILESKQRLERQSEKEIKKAAFVIRQEGAGASDEIHEEADQKSINEKIDESQKAADSASDNLAIKLEDLFKANVKELFKTLEGIEGTEFAKELFERLSIRVAKSNITPENLERLKKAGNISDKLGSFLVSKSFLGEKGFKSFSKLGNFAGSDTHKFVLEAGKFIGVKFKPWEALKWTQNIATLGKWLGVVGSVISVVSEFKAEQDREKLSKNLLEARGNVRAQFNKAANDVELFYDEVTKKFISSNFDNELTSIDAQLSELRDIQTVRTEHFQTLMSLLERTQKLIKDLFSA